MAATKSPPGGQLRHPGPQVVLLVIGAVFLLTLVVLALLSLAGWL